MEAIIEAGRQGADIVEVDIRQTSDGIPVLCHDRKLNRLFGIRKSISSITSSEFKQLRILGTGTPMLLEELLTMDQPPNEIILDIKESAMERRVNELICRCGWEERVIISSFYSIVIGRFKKLNKKLATAIILDRIATIPIALRIDYLNHLFFRSVAADCYHLYYREANINGAKKLTALGHKIAFWTIDNPEEIRKSLTANPYGIMTNTPKSARQVIDAFGESIKRQADYPDK